MGYDVIPVAWSGITAMLLPRGRIVRSRFIVLFVLTEKSEVSSLKVSCEKATFIRKSRLIIWERHFDGKCVSDN